MYRDSDHHWDSFYVNSVYQWLTLTISTTDHRPTSRWSALLCLSRHLVLFKEFSLDGGGGGGGRRRVIYSGQREQSFSSTVWCWGSGVLSSQNPASVLRGFKTNNVLNIWSDFGYRLLWNELIHASYNEIKPPDWIWYKSMGISRGKW